MTQYTKFEDIIQVEILRSIISLSENREETLGYFELYLTQHLEPSFNPFPILHTLEPTVEVLPPTFF